LIAYRCDKYDLPSLWGKLIPQTFYSQIISHNFYEKKKWIKTFQGINLTANQIKPLKTDKANRKHDPKLLYT